MTEHADIFAYLTREPILDISQQIIASTLQLESASTVDAEHMTRCMNTLSVLAQSELSGKTMFISLDTGMLALELENYLSPQKTVLELAEIETLDEALIQRCIALRQKGFKFALHDQVGRNLEMHLFTRQCVDYIKIDVRQQDTEQILTRCKNYQFLSKQLVAMHVDSLEQYNHCKKIGFKLMQGYYFTEPRAYTAKPFNQDFRSILNLLNLLSSGEDLKSIEACFKQDPALSFKLLRYINSVGFGLSCEIQSIRHAITVIGTQQLFKWLTMLMVTAGQNAVAPALIKTSIIRGRLMELLGNSYFGRAGQDNLFVIGVFSLLDVILQVPMEEILSKVDLPDTISQALLDRQGVYGPFLALTEACEAHDPAQIKRLAADMFIGADEVNRCHISALVWADSMSAHP